MSQPVPDGTYDIIVIDAVAHPEDAQRVGRLEITITAGEHKGATFGLNVADLVGTDVDLIGMPGTLHVEDGVPDVTIEP